MESPGSLKRMIVTPWRRQSFVLVPRIGDFQICTLRPTLDKDTLRFKLGNTTEGNVSVVSWHRCAGLQNMQRLSLRQGFRADFRHSCISRIRSLGFSKSSSQASIDHYSIYTFFSTFFFFFFLQIITFFDQHIPPHSSPRSNKSKCALLPSSHSSRSPPE